MAPTNRNINYSIKGTLQVVPSAGPDGIERDIGFLSLVHF